jgi:phosphatidylserine/phosphatidylglycerophosphate/cardiolipin synthase-like enzyme
VESLIRLMRAGWIQMIERSNGVVFQPTQSGFGAAVADELPSVTRRMKRGMTFIVEQISGGVFRSRELPYLHMHVVEERAAREPIVWMDRPSQIYLDEIRPLVDALFQDDERFIAMDQAGDRLAERWSLVRVRDGEPDGLSPRASATLVTAIREAAKKWKGGPLHPSVTYSPQRPASVPSRSNQTHNLSIQTGDILVGGPDHRDALASMLKKARHRVIIHSTFIAEERFDALLPQLLDAQKRGAAIDIMWGQNEQTAETRSTRKVALRLQDRLTAKNIDRIRVHPFSTDSHAKFLLSDTGTMDQFHCIIGSCNWLYSAFESIEISARLRDPHIISEVVAELAELSRGRNGTWTNFTNELAALSAYLESVPRPSPGKAQMTLVKGTQHADLVRTARDGAARCIFVTSHRLSNTAHTVVLAPAIAAAENRGIATEIYYGIKSGPLSGAGLSEIIVEGRQHAVKITPVYEPRLHAKLLAWDEDAAVITSQNWLSADPPDDKPRAEIGLFIRAPGIARQIIERFNAIRR